MSHSTTLAPWLARCVGTASVTPTMLVLLTGLALWTLGATGRPPTIRNWP